MQVATKRNEEYIFPMWTVFLSYGLPVVLVILWLVPETFWKEAWEMFQEFRETAGTKSDTNPK